MLTCTQCNNNFRSRHGLDYHFRRDHQLSVKIKFQNGDMAEVKRRGDNTFKCRCDKRFKLPDSLQKHAKHCSGESIEREEDGEIILMDADDSDTPEFIDTEDRMIPIDCVGTRICHEKADCR
jgi:hypothetical protein